MFRSRARSAQERPHCCGVWGRVIVGPSCRQRSSLAGPWPVFRLLVPGAAAAPSAPRCDADGSRRISLEASSAAVFGTPALGVGHPLTSRHARSVSVTLLGSPPRLRSTQLLRLATRVGGPGRSRPPAFTPLRLPLRAAFPQPAERGFALLHSPTGSVPSLGGRCDSGRFGAILGRVRASSCCAASCPTRPWLSPSPPLLPSCGTSEEPAFPSPSFRGWPGPPAPLPLPPGFGTRHRFTRGADVLAAAAVTRSIFTRVRRRSAFLLNRQFPFKETQIVSETGDKLPTLSSPGRRVPRHPGPVLRGSGGGTSAPGADTAFVFGGRSAGGRPPGRQARPRASRTLPHRRLPCVAPDTCSEFGNLSRGSTPPRQRRVLVHS